jgi:hypothetical protein
MYFNENMKRYIAVTVEDENELNIFCLFYDRMLPYGNIPTFLLFRNIE